MSPQRVQMSRHYPWRAEHLDAVIVARPSKWGNPYRVVRDGVFMEARLYRVLRSRHGSYAGEFLGGQKGRDEAVSQAVRMYAKYAENVLGLDQIRAELAGKDLACWCPLDQPCHADVLLEIANGVRT